jgi:hypothetical protein
MPDFNQLISAPQPSMKMQYSTVSDKAGPAAGVPFDDSAAGVAKVKALKTVWGKKGKRILWLGLALMLSV